MVAWWSNFQGSVPCLCRVQPSYQHIKAVVECISVGSGRDPKIPGGI